ncbi:hypothetical protein M404DRAFT_1002222, partial [Pisolithus tinctorius Marx 270]
ETTRQNVRQVVSLDITIAHRNTPFPKAAVNEADFVPDGATKRLFNLQLEFHKALVWRLER